VKRPVSRLYRWLLRLCSADYLTRKVWRAQDRALAEWPHQTAAEREFAFRVLHKSRAHRRHPFRRDRTP
jgi:hypothetical protein